MEAPLLEQTRPKRCASLRVALWSAALGFIGGVLLVGLSYASWIPSLHTHTPTHTPTHRLTDTYTTEHTPPVGVRLKPTPPVGVRLKHAAGASMELLNELIGDTFSLCESHTGVCVDTQATSQRFSELLHDIANAQYFGSVTLGAQEFNVIFDTGSADFWVPSRVCGWKCLGHHTYDSRRSPSFRDLQRNFTIHYGSGSVQGTMASDKLAFDKIEVPDIPFGLVPDTSGMGLTYILAKFDGIMGLGWPSISVSNSTPVVVALKSAGAIPAAEFSFRLGRSDGEDGALTIGGHDPKYDPIEWHTLSSEGYWAVTLQQILVNQHTNVLDAPIRAVIDTGTSLVVGPAKVIDTLVEVLGGYRYPWLKSVAFINCKQEVADVDFIIDGQKYTIPGRSFVIETGKSDDRVPCILGLTSMELPEATLILGDVFLREYYSVFDYENSRIGFAKTS